MPKFKMAAGALPAVYTKRYSAFRGVDFSLDPCRVDDDRSPWAVNIIADAGGCPQKRPGWRKLAEVEAPVRGIYRFETTVTSEANSDGEISTAEVQEFIVHAGGKLYRWNGGEDVPVQLLSGLTGESSAGFMHNDSVYIFTGKEYVYVRATLAVGASTPTVKAGNVEDVAYTPVTALYSGVVTACNTSNETIYGPNGDDSDGEPYEQANILTKYRRNNYKYVRSELSSEYTSSDNLYLVLDRPLDASATLADLELKTEQGNVIKDVLYFIEDGGVASSREELKLSSTYGNHEKVRRYLWFDHEAFIKKVVALNDTSTSFNVKYPAAWVTKVVGGGKDTPDEAAYRNCRFIKSCRLFNWYNNRLFVAGTDEFPNADWHSELNDPTYFKDIGYTEIGNDDSRILGYLPVGEQQAVIKSDSIQNQDASVYLRRAEWDETDGYYFPLKRGVIGIGALGEHGFATLVDDQMYLSKNGVMGIICENITGERVLHTRSTRINSKLLSEPGLERAVCSTWNGYMLIAVNGNVYVADSRQKSYARNVAGNFEYEWYYWQDFPAACITVRGEEMFFGSNDGKLCRINDDLESDERNSDWPDGLSGEPAGINAVWATRFDDDGDFTVKKNMRRRGCGIFLKGAKNGAVKVQVRLDREYMRDLGERAHGVYDTSDTEFYDVPAELLPPGPVAINKKVKKYSVIQIICSSSEPGDEFGILGIERRFVKGRFVK